MHCCVFDKWHSAMMIDVINLLLIIQYYINVLNCLSWTRTECFVLLDCYILTNVTKIIILYIFRVDVMYSNICVQICLNIVNWNISIFKIHVCMSYWVSYCWISWWEPASLNLCPLLFISYFFLLLSNKIRYNFHRLVSGWIELSCRISSTIKLWICLR